MEKKHIIKFLKDRRRGAYTWLVEMYPDWVSSMSVTMAKELIQEDLAKDSETPVELRYFSLAKAVAKFKKKHGKNSKPFAGRSQMFKDANELKNEQSGPGTFKVLKPNVKPEQ